MLLLLTNARGPATDLGYLLHKNPANVHPFSLPFGEAHVFYPEATVERCTAALLLSINPVELVRGREGSGPDGGKLDQYVNDRPYTASSFLSVAMTRVFGTALAGNCNRRPELVEQRLPLTLTLPVVRCRGGEGVLRRLFEPLGYQVTAEPLPPDPALPEWGGSRLFRLTLSAETTVHDILTHVYVLLPVLDDEKHYYIGQDEVEKLLRHGEGWLPQHPDKKFIVERYLQRRVSLVRPALERLLGEEEPAEASAESVALTEQNLERPMTLHTQRLKLVHDELCAAGAKRVVDLGCGEGRLLRLLLADRRFEQIVGMDVSYRSLEAAQRKLRLERMPERQRARLQLMHGSLLYRDARLKEFDAAAVVEVIEHLDAPRLQAFERVVFAEARPRTIVVTTPNREYNVLFPTLPAGTMRHGDHRFEWTRAEFKAWCQQVAERHGYAVRHRPVGPEDAQHGAPSQMAVFTRQEAA